MIASTRARETTFVPNGNDDDVIINYITDMDLGEDGDSLDGLLNKAALWPMALHKLDISVCNFDHNHLFCVI